VNEDELSEAAEEAWVLDRREDVVAYLARLGHPVGEVGDWPAWHLAPYVSIWAIESLSRPGWVGWWAISGDLPTDYCTVEEPRHPRTAVKAFAATWRAAANDLRSDGTLGETGLPASLAPLLASRADFLTDLAEDDEIWIDV
jgi:hypothetical protein